MLERLSTHDTRRAPTFATLALGATLLSACSTAEAGNRTFDSSYSTKATLHGGVAAPGSFVRTDPLRIQDVDMHNACARPKNAIVLPEVADIIVASEDANGPYYGFEVTALPENIQEQCANDADGRVWIAASNILAGGYQVSPTTP